jgi:hypothetical protein
MAPAISKHHLVCAPAPFDLHHFGFLKSGNNRKFKFNFYYKLLKKQIREYPNEPIGYFHLAFHEFENGNEEKGIKLLEKSLSLKKDFFLAHKELGRKYIEKALYYFSNASTSTPPNHYYYDWLCQTKNKLEAILGDSINGNR